MELLTPILDVQVWVAFLTLTALELVLGIDNIIFISILVGRLPSELQQKARMLGLFFAMFLRVALLLALSWLVGLTAPLFTVMERPISGRDLILLCGGLFLVWKSTREIHHMVDTGDQDPAQSAAAGFSAVIVQVIVIDLVFSLDSIVTAVGMVDNVSVMIAAVMVSVALMMIFAGAIGRFVSGHPTIKMLALAFLIVVGVALVAEAFGHKLPKGYIYFAMAFATVVETLNIRMRKRRVP